MDIAGNQTILCFLRQMLHSFVDGDISWHGTCNRGEYPLCDNVTDRLIFNCYPNGGLGGFLRGFLHLQLFSSGLH